MAAKPLNSTPINLRDTEVFVRPWAEQWAICTTGTRRVLQYEEWVNIRDARFIVSEAGRDYVRRTRRNLVHAGVRGVYHTSRAYSRAMGQGDPYELHSDTITLPGWVEVSYNPHKNDTFIERATGRAVVGAERVTFTSDRKVFAYGLAYADPDKPVS